MCVEKVLPLEETDEGPVGTIQFRVRYKETDQMGVVYHSNYFAYFEMGRTELMSSLTGVRYRDLEKANVKMVVAAVDCVYHKPAEYDDLLTLKTRASKLGRASLTHEYKLYRGDELLVVGHTKLVTVDPTGKIVPVPDWLRHPRKISKDELANLTRH